MTPALLDMVSPLGALRAGDAAVALALLLFAMWGAHRGPLRQVLSLSVLLAAFFVAGRHGALLEPTIAKLTSLGPDERMAASWLGVLFLCLVAGSIVLRFISARLAPRSEERMPRVLGGLLGLVKGGFVVIVVGYALLAASGETPEPALTRTGGGATGEAAAPEAPESGGWTSRLQGSVSAGCLESGSELLTRWIEVPAWVRRQMAAVDRRLE